MKRLGQGIKRPWVLEMSPELRAVQELMPMSPEDRERLAQDIKKNGIRHPIICYENDGKSLVLAGWHRREIAVELELQEVPVEIIEAPPRERREFCINENLARRHLTQKQKERIAQEFFRIKPDTSARQIAERVGISPTTASTIKKKAVVQIGQLPVKGRDGKTYAHTPKPAAEIPAKAPTQVMANINEVLFNYAAKLSARAERLYRQGMSEPNKQKAAGMIGEARAFSQVVQDLEKLLK
jgi:hypothetical protein